MALRRSSLGIMVFISYPALNETEQVVYRRNPYYHWRIKTFFIELALIEHFTLGYV